MVGLQSVGSFTSSFGRAYGCSPTRLPRRLSTGGGPGPDPDVHGARLRPSESSSFGEDSRLSLTSVASDHTTTQQEASPMQMQLTTVNQWVHDQDEALEFYTEKLGMELRDDVTVPEMGNFRWLTVGPVGQPDIAVVLMAIPGPPVFEPETTAQLQGPRGEGRRRRPVLPDRRHPGDLRGAEGPRASSSRRSRRSSRTASTPGSATRRATRSADHAEREPVELPVREGSAGGGALPPVSRPRAGRRRTRAARAGRSRRRHHGRRTPSRTGSSACAGRRPSSPARLRPSRESPGPCRA